MKTFDGKLIIDRTPDGEWGMLVVDDGCVDNVVCLFNDYLKDDFGVMIENM